MLWMLIFTCKEHQNVSRCSDPDATKSANCQLLWIKGRWLFICMDDVKGSNMRNLKWKRFFPDMNVVSQNRTKDKWTDEVHLQTC